MIKNLRKNYGAATSVLWVGVCFVLASCGMMDFKQTSQFTFFKLQAEQASKLPADPTPTKTPVPTPTPGTWTNPATGIAISPPGGFSLALGVCQGPINIKAVRSGAEAPAPVTLTIALAGFATTELFSRAGCAAGDAFSVNTALNTPLTITAGDIKAKNPRNAEGFYIKTQPGSLAPHTLVAVSTPNSWTASLAMGSPALVITSFKVVDPAAPGSGATAATAISLPAGRCSQRIEVWSQSANNTLVTANTTALLSNSRGLPFYSNDTCTTVVTSLPFVNISQMGFYLREASVPNTLIVTATPPANQASQIASGSANFTAVRAVNSIRLDPASAPQLGVGVCSNVPFQLVANDVTNVPFGSGTATIQDSLLKAEFYQDAACTQPLTMQGAGVYTLPFANGVSANFYMKPKHDVIAAGYRIQAALTGSTLTAEKVGSLKLVPVKIIIIGPSSYTASQCGLLRLRLVDFYGNIINPLNTIYPITLQMLNAQGQASAPDANLRFFNNDGNAFDRCGGSVRTVYQVPEVPGQAPLSELLVPFADLTLVNRTVRLRASIGIEPGEILSIDITRRAFELDPLFNQGEIPAGVLGLPQDNTELHGLTLGAGGHIFAVGSSGPEATRKYVVAKSKPWGGWDNAFSGGVVEFAAGAKSSGAAVLPQGNTGNFLVGGWSILDAVSGLSDFSVTRFSETDPAQRPDLSYGGANNGINLAGFTTMARGQAMASFADGRYVLAGTNGDKMAIALFSATGALIERKGLQFSAGSVDHANGVLVTPLMGSERILIAGDTQVAPGTPTFALVCLKVVPADPGTGSILALCDDFANGAGKVTANFGIGATSTAAAVMKQGEKLVVAGTTDAKTAPGQMSNNVALARYLEDGRLDDSLASPSGGAFGPGVNGLAIHDLRQDESVVSAIIGRDNRIVVVGISKYYEQTRGFIARFAPNGASASADPASLVQLSFQNRPTTFTGVVVDSWGRLVLSGHSLADVDGDPKGFVMRLFE